MVLDLLKKMFDKEEQKQDEHVIIEEAHYYKVTIIKSSCCIVCNRDLGGMSMYKCKYCGLTVCEDHRLPEKHDCYKLTPTTAEIRKGSTTINYHRK